MEKEFISYELALRMKQLGFNESCFAFYNGKHLDLGIWDWEYPAGQKRRDIGECPQAPLLQQAFRWFREKQEIEGFVHKSIEGNYYFVIKKTGNNESNMYEFTKTTPKTFDTYEEAELACLEKLIEIVEGRGE